MKCPAATTRHAAAASAVDGIVHQQCTAQQSLAAAVWFRGEHGGHQTHSQASTFHDAHASGGQSGWQTEHGNSVLSYGTGVTVELCNSRATGWDGWECTPQSQMVPFHRCVVGATGVHSVAGARNAPAPNLVANDAAAAWPPRAQRALTSGCTWHATLTRPDQQYSMGRLW
jgi:hypothetical protein